jgi:hypothetical protein
VEKQKKIRLDQAEINTNKTVSGRGRVVELLADLVKIDGGTGATAFGAAA